MGSKGVEGPTLFDKFENALQDMGIVMEFGDDPSTELNETLESEHYYGQRCEHTTYRYRYLSYHEWNPDHPKETCIIQYYG
jgi:hypothetical protein